MGRDLVKHKGLTQRKRQREFSGKMRVERVRIWFIVVRLAVISAAGILLVGVMAKEV